MASLDLNEVYSFVYIVKQGGVGKAARALRIPKSTISRRLKNLEAKMGVSLIQRNTRQFNVTRSGHEFYKTCESALNQIEEAEKLARLNVSAPQGLVRMTTPAELDRSIIAAIAQFQKKYPLIELEIQALDRNVDLIGEGFDLALRAGNLPDSSMKSIKIAEGKFILVASPDYFFGIKKLESPSELNECRCLAFTGKPDPFLWKLSDGKKTLSIKVNAPIQANSALSIKQLAIEGSGIAFLPERLVTDSLQSGELVRILPQWSGLKSPYNIIFPTQKNLPQKVRLLIEHIKNHYKQNN